MTDASSVNADAHELARFSSLAHEWWDLEGPFKALHQINPLRLEWISQFQSLSGLDVLDVGCGGGILTDAMARKGAQATGIDLANASIQVAQLHALDAQTPNVKYLCMSAEALAEQAPASFDVVTCMEMLEHVPHPESIIQACSRLVKPQGWVFFSTLNRQDRKSVV